VQGEGADDGGFAALPAAIEQDLSIAGPQECSLPGVGRNAPRLKNAGI